METVVKKLYEAMFLVDSGLAASDWDGVLAEIKRILDRSEVEIVALKKWDERLLAYEVKKKSRGDLNSPRAPPRAKRPGSFRSIPPTTTSRGKRQRSSLYAQIAPMRAACFEISLQGEVEA